MTSISLQSILPEWKDEYENLFNKETYASYHAAKTFEERQSRFAQSINDYAKTLPNDGFISVEDFLLENQLDQTSILNLRTFSILFFDLMAEQENLLNKDSQHLLTKKFDTTKQVKILIHILHGYCYSFMSNKLLLKENVFTKEGHSSIALPTGIFSFPTSTFKKLFGHFNFFIIFKDKEIPISTITLVAEGSSLSNLYDSIMLNRKQMLITEFWEKTSNKKLQLQTATSMITTAGLGLTCIHIKENKSARHQNSVIKKHKKKKIAATLGAMVIIGTSYAYLLHN